MQNTYNVFLKGGIIQPFFDGTTIIKKSCKNAPKFYVLNEIVNEINRCDIRKFHNLEQYFRSCPLKKKNDLRLLLMHDIGKLNDLVIRIKKTCSTTIALSIASIESKIKIENWLILLNRLGGINDQIYPGINDQIKQLKQLFYRNDNSLKQVASNLQSCEEIREQLQYFFTYTLQYYERLRTVALVFEKQINITLTRKCQASVNHCGSRIYVEQKDTRYSTTQLVYFFKNFGYHYNGYITQLMLVKTLTRKEAEIVAPHICNISRLYLFNSDEYQLEMLRIFAQEILNCPNRSLMDTLMIDYRLLNRTFHCITTQEMPLKKIHNVEMFIVRIFSNTNRGFKLLHENILQHHHLPSYKLRHLQICLLYTSPSPRDS